MKKHHYEMDDLNIKKKLINLLIISLKTVKLATPL